MNIMSSKNSGNFLCFIRTPRIDKNYLTGTGNALQTREKVIFFVFRDYCHRKGDFFPKNLLFMKRSYGF